MRSDEAGQKVSVYVERYLLESGYSAEGYEERRFRVSVGPLVLTFPNPGRLRYHDLHHVVSGYRTGLVGEAEVSIYELRGGCPTKLILLLCLGSIGIGWILSPRRVVKAWRNACGSRTLYDSPIPYENLAEMEIAELRKSLNVPADGWAS